MTVNNQTTQDRNKGQNSENRHDTNMQQRQQPRGQAGSDKNSDRERQSNNDAGGPQR